MFPLAVLKINVRLALSRPQMRQVKYSPALAIHYLSSLPSFHEFHLNVSHKEGDIWVTRMTVTRPFLVCP